MSLTGVINSKFFVFSQSEKAGQISQHQLLVALRLGNPILVAQCKVFAAFSFIQRGQLKLAAKIVRYITKNLSSK